MGERRSGRLPALISPLALLDDVEPGRRAIVSAMTGLTVGGPHYVALARALDALDRLAAELGRPGHYAAKAPHMRGR